MASRQEFLDSIWPDMGLTEDFFKRIYGYEISFPGFSEIALSYLEKAGYDKVRNYYVCFVAELKHKHNNMMKSVAKWYKGQCKKEFENMKRKAVMESIGNRRRQEYKFDGFPEDW